MARKGQGKQRGQTPPADHAVTFDCPSCGAPAYVPSDTNAVRCEYCGNNNMVPAGLRPHPPTLQHGLNVVIHTGMDASMFGEPANLVRRSKSRGCRWAVGFITIFALVIGIVLFFGLRTWFASSNIPWAFSMPTIPPIARATPTPEYAQKILSFGGRGRGPGFFTNAIDITSDSAGDIYVLEGNTGRVQRFDREGKYLNGWVVEDNQLSAIAADRATNNVYVVSKPKIYKYDGPTGSFLGMTREKGSGFSPTEDVGIYPDGSLLTYVAGDGDDLVRLDADGQELGRFNKVFSSLLGEGPVSPAPWNIRLVADAQERMLVLHTPDLEIFIFGPDGKYITRFTDESNKYSFASDIAADTKGRIYVGHLRGILVFDYTGHTIADIAYSPGNSVEALEVTNKDELLALLSSGEVVKLALPEQ